MRVPATTPLASRAKSRIATAFVLSAFVFAILSLSRGIAGPYRQWIVIADANWFAMAALTIVLAIVSSRSFVRVKNIVSRIAGLLALFFALISALGLLKWQPFWNLLNSFQISQRAALPIALFSVFAVWFAACALFMLRALVRWIGKRYEHHGFAVGVGPIYFYFRRRKTS
jgi:hypothetical protein